jgi:Astacin (Peptidase family M12A)
MSQHDLGKLPAICRPRYPAPERWMEVARQAQQVRADNVPDGIDLDRLARPGHAEARGRLMLNIRLRWPDTGVRLSVGFVDNPSQALRTKILTHMNMWNKTANVAFVETTTDVQHADVRIARTPGDGHWSWLGVDILNHPDEPTMNLDGFTESVSDSEFKRVVCHEAGHTLGFPHEHLRAELVARLDRQKTVDHFMATQGWTKADVEFQLLTPLAPFDHLGTAVADPHSIMCYEVPGNCTIDGQPIVGGVEIDARDYEFAGIEYPKVGA